MKTKSTKSKKIKLNSLGFPKLMESEGIIVLFTDEKTGTCVFTPDPKKYPLGLTSTSWKYLEFKEYKGVVKLKNGKK